MFPEFIKFLFIFISFSVATIPEFSNLSTEIPSFAINFFVVIVSLEVKELLVKTSPLLSVSSVTFIFPIA
ncbi:hypothetical protein [Fusobacterium animalis]|uniref:hypothetical protein n=1 Tax=Fusobacterium animalis TaxID=76859 RepID=UPI00130E0D96|nr:hypothetical protein [Fusobacterium animalis]